MWLWICDFQIKIVIEIQMQIHVEIYSSFFALPTCSVLADIK